MEEVFFFHGRAFQRSAVRAVVSCPSAAKESLASSAYKSLVTGGYEAVSFSNRPKLLTPFVESALHVELVP